MSILTVASGKSVYCGYEYYKAKKVQRMEQIGDGEISASVTGSGGSVYDVQAMSENHNAPVLMLRERESSASTWLRCILPHFQRKRKNILESWRNTAKKRNSGSRKRKIAL